MKKFIILALITMFLAIGPPAHSSTVSVAPDGSVIVNLTTYDLNAPYHGEVVFTADGNDYMTAINHCGNAFAWGYVEYDYWGYSYLYVSDDGYNYYYYGRSN